MYINGLKYACSTCIKGHRSSHCSHVDRPLFEIRKKGRPVTQCTFCRDLRKTKQVHIKCACSDKKETPATLQQPLLIYRNTNQSTTTVEDVCQEKKTANKQCTCPSTAAAAIAASKATPMVRSSSGNSNSYLSNQHPQQQQQQQDTPTQMNVTRDTLLAPLCPTAPSAVKEENLSYSWALITSPSSNQVDLPNTSSAPSNQLFTDMMMDDDNEESNNNLHLGFIFHKPTSSQRFLDGQPRIRRRRSTKRTTTTAPTTASTPNRLPINALVDLTVDTLTEYSLSTPPSSAVSPHPPSSNSSAIAACEPMDMQFDYLTQQLEILSNTSNTNDNFMGDLANAEELTAILNNVLQKDEIEEGGSVSSTANSHRSSVSTSVEPLVSQPTTNPMMPNTTPMNRSHCGSFVPRSKCCKPLGATGGESVVITITPLNTSNTDPIDKQQQHMYPTTTRIVTCYCGNQCTCPGCLVHPGNFFLGSDPYSGPLIPSSSASSSCYGSDEEDTTTSNTNHMLNHFMPFS